MAITLDTVTSGVAAVPNTTLTYAHTASGSNLAACVGVAHYQVTAPSPTCTYDGTSMTSEAHTTNTNDYMAALFSLPAAGVGPSTTTNANVALANCGTGFGVQSGCITLAGVDQTDPTRAVATAQAPTVDVTSVADDWVLDIIADAAVVTVGAGQTEQYFADGTTLNAKGSTETATGISTTMSWTGADNAESMIGASFVPSTATAAIPRFLSLLGAGA